jgi:hypothetical protein
MLAGHEFVHLVGGARGYTHPSHSALLGVGTGDPAYEASEEGRATLVEMLLGQPIDHQRQVVFAARYYAIAKALETTVDPATGELRAKYSIQDIYNQLREFNIDENTASTLVWRIMRGTTLQRKIVTVKFANGIEAQIPEVYIKDGVYFEGSMLMYDTFVDRLRSYVRNKTNNAQDERLAGADKRSLQFVLDYLNKIEHDDLRPNVLAATSAVLMGVSKSKPRNLLDKALKIKEFVHSVHSARAIILDFIDDMTRAQLSLDELKSPEWQAVLNDISTDDHLKISHLLGFRK